MDRGAPMTVVATKLTAPTPPAQLVRRSRLDALLDDAVDDPSRRLALVSAPAGSGKSTLVAAWLDRRNEATAWLQADSADSDPARFWTHLVAALAPEIPDIDAAVSPVIPSSGSDPSLVVDRLVNVLTAAAPIVLTIDDYHLISSTAINDGLERLIELAPPSLTIVLSTRVDPSVRLSRLRVGGQLTELRANELRFASDEAASLLGSRGGDPAPRHVAALCERTEGWAAGLVLAGLSLAASDDGDAFVADFQGDDRLVVDYLTEEFLSGMSSETRDRLIRTSVLGRLCGPLVDACCDSDDGSSWLSETAAANQLLIGLDRTGTWYRYHHLLGDLLRLEAQRTIPADLPELHRRAARFHLDNGNAHEAVEHLLNGRHVAEAADLIYDEATELMNRGQLKTVSDQIDRLGSLADEHAGVAVVRGWIALLTGRFAESERCLRLARTLEPNDDEAGLIVALAIMTNMAIGDVASALDEARSAGDPVDSTQAMTLGGARIWGGDFDGARPFLSLAAEMAEHEGNGFVAVIAPIFAAVAELESNRPDVARRTALHSIGAADEHGFVELAQTALAHSVVARTAVTLDDAVESAQQGVVLARKAPENIMLAYALASAGDVLCHHGHADGEQLLGEARSIVDRCVDPGIVGTYLVRVEARHRVSLPTPRTPELVEELTDRELAVLRYFPSELSQRDIASELYVSLNTVKSHSKAIYRKLGVGDRKAAVQAARDVGVL